jgi:hypothetical protein
MLINESLGLKLGGENLIDHDLKPFALIATTYVKTKNY